MAQIIASTMNNNPYTGEDGNSSTDHGYKLLAAAAIADTIDLLTIPAGAKMIEVCMINAALGALSTISLGYRNKDGTANAAGTNVALLAATSTVAAGKTRSVFAPIVFAKDAVLYATVAGGAVTGQLDVVTEYVYQGTL
jgi:hypothetical protein